MTLVLPIRCYIFHDHRGLIFDPTSIRHLREQYRIIGCFTGTLADQPRQNNELGSPLELSVEEFCLLANEKIVSLYQILLPIEDKHEDSINYLAELDQEFRRQEIANGNQRIEEILLRRDSILENARRSTNRPTVNESPLVHLLLESNNAWLNCSRNLEDHEKEILLSIIEQRLKQFTTEQMLIEINRESRRTNLQLDPISLEQFRKTLSDIDRLRTDVFADLYQRKYWISNGYKFGGDFLVYLDDPSRCHSTFIVTCVFRDEIGSSSTVIPLTNLIARCRVAVHVRKTCVLASRKSVASSEIDYLTISWSGF